MTAIRNWLVFSALFFCHLGRTEAMAPSGENWFTIRTPHFRVHHTAPLEIYARALARSFETALPEIEKRLAWKAPSPIDIVVADPTDSANGLAMNFPNNFIELFSSPFASDSVLAYYHDWANELATHELTHIVANDTTLGNYQTLRSIFGSWVKPNGIQPLWITEGLAVFQETSLSLGGRGRSPLLEALLREATRKEVLDDPGYSSLDRFNDGVPWWPAGSTSYLLGYTIQALPTREIPNLPGKISQENAGTWIFAPDRVAKAVTGGRDWAQIWAEATGRLRARYTSPVGEELNCALTKSGRFTGGHALSSDGWVYFSEEDWDYGEHLARIRADAPCGQFGIERLERKKFGGPSQVAVSPSGKRVLYSALDPEFETQFSDLFSWTAAGSQRVTRRERARDPAFLDEDRIVYIRANPDTSETIVLRHFARDESRELFTGKPLEKLSNLFANQGRILASLHFNNGHEKIVEIRGNEAIPLIRRMHPSREFERNPFIGEDGRLYFAAVYGNSPQELYALGASGPELVLSGSSGYLDRPVLLPGTRSLIFQQYGLNGLNLVRASLNARTSNPNPQTSDLHEFLTTEKPQAIPLREESFPPSEPYSLESSGTSLWPHYWFPELGAAMDGFVAGASTSGNDALNYHRWHVLAQYDSRARFPIYRAYYHNRVSTTNFHFEAQQTNSYLAGSKTSNRHSTYSVEAVFPAGDLRLGFGTAFKQKRYFASSTDHVLLFQNIGYDGAGKTPSAIAPNWGAGFNLFTAEYPSSRYESSFVDLRPDLKLYFRGIHPSHSVGLALAAGVSTNQFLASNYYLGGGASPLNETSFIVRGYPAETLFGQRIATANLAYTLPIAQIYRGLSTNPVFLKNLGLRFMGDAGTAKYLALYSGGNLLRYERDRFFQKFIFGAGADLIANGSIFYHVPISLAAGIHQGTQKRYGGDTFFYFAVGVGLDRGSMR